MDKGKKIVLIGSGNLAFHLAALLVKKGHEIVQFVGRNAETTSELGMKYFTSHVTDLKLINKSAEIYIICVNDTEIAKLASQLKLPNKLVLHTSGTVGLSVIKTVSSQTGVLYPLQTFSKSAKVKWSKTPFLIEGNNLTVTKSVEAFASGLVKNVYKMTSAQRLKFHVAAVLACNFTNHLYSLSKKYLESEKINHFDLLYPLISQTVKKIKRTDPSDAQTGPAVRGDKATIETHLKLLNTYPNTKKIYSVLSESIIASKDGKL